MNNNNYVTKIFSSAHQTKPNKNPLCWKLTIPEEDNISALVIVLAEWVYGLLPYCGPGSRETVWELERNFQDQVIQYFLSNGVAVLYLDLDHWFRTMPDDAGDRISERISGRCIDNPINQRFLKNCLIFVDSL